MSVTKFLMNRHNINCDSKIKQVDVSNSDSTLEITYKKFYENIITNVSIFQKYFPNRKIPILFIVDKSILSLEYILTANYLGYVIMISYSQITDKNLLSLITYYGILNIICNFKDKYQIFREKAKTIAFEDNYFFINLKENNCKKKYIDKKCRFIFFTSGTSSISKAVMLSDENVISNIIGIADYLNINSYYSSLIYKNICHASTLIGEFFVSLYTQSSIILTSILPHPNFIAQIIKDFEINVLFAIPSFVCDLFSENKQSLSSLKIVNFYGDYVRDQIFEIIKNNQNTEFIYSYGLTEASPRVTYIKSEDIINRKGSVGCPIKKTKIYIDKVIENSIGEILVKGPGVMLGYYSGQDKTEKIIKRKKLYTGDLGYLDKDGFLYVVGRKDSMFIKNGNNIYPEEIEKTILCINPEIRDVEIEYKNDEIICKIKVNSKEKVNVKDLYCSISNEIEQYKVPDKILIVDKINLNQNGKKNRKKR